MKGHRTERKKSSCQVIIMMPNSKEVLYNIRLSHMKELKKLLEKYSEKNDKTISWEELARERIEKYKKAGLVLRGMRYREGLSQKKLAEMSRVSQNEISKIENGKRTVGKKVAKRLATALNIDYRLLYHTRVQT